MTHSSPEQNPFRLLPSVSDAIAELGDVGIEPGLLTELIRNELAGLRGQIGQGRPVSRMMALEQCRQAIADLNATRFDPVINGTGIVLHTNLGRSPVSEVTARAMADAASSYLSLEIDPETNLRGGRMAEVSRLMRLLIGAEAALVVNNNAAAVLLTLAALCADREVVVSRGEAVEIGGGFRIPDVIAQSGCRLVEVGTTNRTYLADYRRAVTGETAAFLKVHASNFQIEGFTAGVTTSELGEFSAQSGLPLIEDLGSGALLDTERFGLRHEPTAREAISAGAAIVTLSGDKLLGGPQAGIVAGRRELVGRIEQHPLARAVRADKVTLAGICATLWHYIRGNAEREIPIWRMIGVRVEELWRRAHAISETTGCGVVSSTASVGGGSLPGETLPSTALRFVTGDADGIAQRLRSGNPRIFPIIRDGAVLIDLRTVQESQDRLLCAALRHAMS